MRFSKKSGLLVFCVLMPLLSAVLVEGGSVVRLGETVPRAILFGLGLFAWWLAIWLVGFRLTEAMLARKRIADPVDRWRAELGVVIRIWLLGSCAIVLFIAFPWAQGFTMPRCSVLAVKLFLFYSLVSGIAVAWVVLHLRMALKTQKSAHSNAEDVRDSRESASLRARSRPRSGGPGGLGSKSALALTQP